MSIAYATFHSPPAGDAEVETVGDLRQSVTFEWPVMEVLRSSKIAVLE